MWRSASPQQRSSARTAHSAWRPAAACTGRPPPTLPPTCPTLLAQTAAWRCCMQHPHSESSDWTTHLAGGLASMQQFSLYRSNHVQKPSLPVSRACIGAALWQLTQASAQRLRPETDLTAICARTAGVRLRVQRPCMHCRWQLCAVRRMGCCLLTATACLGAIQVPQITIYS